MRGRSTHGNDPVKRLTDKETNWKSLQTAFFEEAESPAGELHFVAERGRESQKKRAPNHPEAGIESTARRRS